GVVFADADCFAHPALVVSPDVVEADSEDGEVPSAAGVDCGSEVGQDVAAGCSSFAVVVGGEGDPWVAGGPSGGQDMDVAAFAPFGDRDLFADLGAIGLDCEAGVVGFVVFHQGCSEPADPQLGSGVFGVEGSGVAGGDAGGRADGGGVRRHGCGDDGVGADAGVLADGDAGGDRDFVRDDRAGLDGDWSGVESAGPRGDGLTRGEGVGGAGAVVVVVDVDHVGDSCAASDVDAGHGGQDDVLAEGGVVAD